MKLSISNIAWSAEHDLEMYDFLKENSYSGLEIAPTRILPELPYQRLSEAKQFQLFLETDYNLKISSIQSICFGKNEPVFGSAQERKIIFDYVKEAIDFASAISCNNVVFGSPKNRIIHENQWDIALDFFGQLGDYAASKNTVLAIEPNPTIYGTNFINTTPEAFDFVKQVNSKGLMVNLDFGTCLNNSESLSDIKDNLHLVNHIHISEPYLEEVQEREAHDELSKMLQKMNYDNFVSIEMKNLNSIALVKNKIQYVKQLFYAE
jgi:sugar phosphate isomerase/epimerase